MIFGFFLLLLLLGRFVKLSTIEAREALEHGLLRLLKSNLRSEVISEAAMALEVTKMAVPGNMHIHPKVTEVSYIKFEVKSDLEAQWGCLEVAVAFEAK